MFMKQPKPRGFEYFPYYLHESDEDEELARHQIKFRRLGRHQIKKTRPTIVLAILALAVFILWQYFGELVRKDPKANTVKTFQVEEVTVVE